MSFNISFDYRFDTLGFFDNPDARAALEAAAGVWESVIGDEFENVPAGVSFFVSHPNTGSSTQVVLEEEIDDLLIFIGASSSPFGLSGSEPAALPEGMCACSLCSELHASETEAASVLARAGYSGFGASGDALNARISSNFRGDGAATDFEPYAGVASFNPDFNWHYGIESTPSGGEFDFLTVAVHEIGHVLGIGTAGAFDRYIDGPFYGPNAVQVNGGSGLPLHSDNAHVQAGYAGNSVVMDPSIASGQRIPLSEYDKAILADIGYEVPGYTKQGSLHPIATENGETIFGTIVADDLDGLGGNDQMQGNSGADTLNGNAGNDTLFGQNGDDSLMGGSGSDFIIGGSGADWIAGGAGIDTLYGDGGADTFYVAPGDGTDTIADLELGTDDILISAEFDLSVGDVLGSITKPFSNVSRITLDETTVIDVIHSSQSGTPITEADILIEQASTPNSAPTATPDTATTESGQAVTIDVVANDTDPDEDPLTISNYGEPGSGTLEVINNQFVFTPDENFTGTVQWDYAIEDGNGGGSGSFVTVAVTAPNQAPTANPDTANTVSGQSVTIDVLANDTDPDQDLLTVSNYGETGDGTIEVVDDQFVFTPNANFTGTAQWDYAIDDGRGGGSGSYVSVTVGPASIDWQGDASANVWYGNDANDTLRGDLGNDTLGGGSGDDLVAGGGDDDQLFGEDGNDVVQGGAGFDVLFGNSGADRLIGDWGIASEGQGDTLNGGSGDDTLEGEGGADRLFGGLGDDSLIGGQGFDTAFAGSGDDTVEGGSEGDALYGESGDDSLSGDGGIDLLVGGSGNDTIEGGSEDDFLDGGADDDSLSGGGGIDILLGGAGADTLEGDGDVDILLGGSGGDTLRGGSGNDRVFGEGGADRVEGGSGNDLVFGNAGNDTALGGSGDDFVIGEAGDDSLLGDAGNDIVVGGSGSDTLEGGAGADLLDGGQLGDDLSGGAGMDTLFGVDGDDTLSGGLETDVLRGGSGADRLIAGPGDDRMGGDDGADTFVFAAGDGTDLVFDLTLGTDLIEFTGGVAADFSALTITDDGLGRATIAYNSGVPADVITLIGVTAAELSDDGTFLFT
ncbi:MAG: Ig-like domain-containing protein [Pseudomonadota bacterium]